MSAIKCSLSIIVIWIYLSLSPEPRIFHATGCRPQSSALFLCCRNQTSLGEQECMTFRVEHGGLQPHFCFREHLQHILWNPLCHSLLTHCPRWSPLCHGLLTHCPRVSIKEQHLRVAIIVNTLPLWALPSTANSLDGKHLVSHLMGCGCTAESGSANGAGTREACFLYGPIRKIPSDTELNSQGPGSWIAPVSLLH